MANERRKMYNDLTHELIQALEKDVLLTNEYNANFGKSPEERETILKKLLKSIVNNFYANFDCVMLDGGGIEIGDNTVIGFGSVVTKDIPSNVVAVGVPCRVIKEITVSDKTGYIPC